MAIDQHKRRMKPLIREILDDKGVVAAAIRKSDAALRGDPQEAVKALARNSISVLTGLRQRVLRGSESLFKDDGTLSGAGKDLIFIENTLRNSLKFYADLEGMNVTCRRLRLEKELHHKEQSVADMIVSLGDDSEDGNAACD